MRFLRPSSRCRLPTPPVLSSRRGLSDKIRPIEKVRLKWVKNRGFDHIIERDSSVKAASLLKDLILRTPTSSLSSRFLPPLQKPLGLTVPPLRFLRRYPSLFLEGPDPRFPSLPSFRLSATASLLHRLESESHLSTLPDTAHRLARLLMMCNSRSLPLKSLIPLKYDLGLPDDFHSSLIPQFPDLFRLTRRNGTPVLELSSWHDDLAISRLQRLYEEGSANSPNLRLTFPMSFPKGYGGMKKVKAWMDDFDRLPYLSPYEDVSCVNPESEIMEKHVVGVLHELLSLTLHKKTKRNYLRCLREEMNLPHKFTRVFTRYPGIFYLSLKCKTTTVMLREAYRRGKLVDPHPLTRVRDKYYYVMRTGLIYRGKAEERLLVGEGELGAELDGSGESEEEEFCEGTASEEDDSGAEED